MAFTQQTTDPNPESHESNPAAKGDATAQDMASFQKTSRAAVDRAFGLATPETTAEPTVEMVTTVQETHAWTLPELRQLITSAARMMLDVTVGDAPDASTRSDFDLAA